jgi:hypothetical protein
MILKEHKFFPPDYNENVLAAKMCTMCILDFCEPIGLITR